MAHIEVHDLRKTFHVSERSSGIVGALRGVFSRRHRVVQALGGVSFSVERGELVGYIGPNGAGKSTTVKVMSGILVPDGGTCTVAGLVPWESRREHVARIGVVFGQRTQLWWDLPAIESFELLRDVYALDPSRYRRRLAELVSVFDLSPLLDVPVRQLSLGQRMRCDIAASLLHEPEVLFLDEPTIGLDAVAKLAVRDLIRRLNAETRLSVMLTTHDMDDVEALCSRVLVIANGTILCDGGIDALRRRVGDKRRLVVDLEEPAPAPALADAELVELNGKRLVFRYDPQEIPTERLIRRLGAAYRIRDLYVEHEPIERIVAELYSREARVPG
jgi:ABC-2 type transport system ATP-binding protein